VVGPTFDIFKSGRLHAEGNEPRRPSDGRARVPTPDARAQAFPFDNYVMTM
jgi:hypothetical protein